MLMFKAIHIYDMDGVLVDTSHRYRNHPNGAIDLEYWIANHTPDNMARDTLLPMVAQYRDDCRNPNIYTIICTARSDSAIDRDWVANTLGNPNLLIMRPAGDMTGDAILKRRQLSRLFNLRQFRNTVKRFWDDNAKNLEALRKYGVECFHVKSEQGHK